MDYEKIKKQNTVGYLIVSNSCICNDDDAEMHSYNDIWPNAKDALNSYNGWKKNKEEIATTCPNLKIKTNAFVFRVFMSVENAVLMRMTIEELEAEANGNS